MLCYVSKGNQKLLWWKPEDILYPLKMQNHYNTLSKLLQQVLRFQVPVCSSPKLHINSSLLHVWQISEAKVTFSLCRKMTNVFTAKHQSPWISLLTFKIPPCSFSPRTQYSLKESSWMSTYHQSSACVCGLRGRQMTKMIHKTLSWLNGWIGMICETNCVCSLKVSFSVWCCKASILLFFSTGISILTSSMVRKNLRKKLGLGLGIIYTTGLIQDHIVQG